METEKEAEKSLVQVIGSVAPFDASEIIELPNHIPIKTDCRRVCIASYRVRAKAA